jgi:hypothetical protein
VHSSRGRCGAGQGSRKNFAPRGQSLCNLRTISAAFAAPEQAVKITTTLRQSFSVTM